MPDDLRLIEDYLPIEAISKEASREKSVRKGHISTLHLWWARRPLVACRAAVYGALVPADRWVKEVDIKNPPTDPAKAERVANGKKKGLNRKAAKDFVTKLCRYPKTNPTKPADVKLKNETEAAIVEAQRHILEAHADRLTAELVEAKKTGQPPAWVEEFKFTGDKVTYDEIVAGRAPRPRVLDMFAGGGAIPLEALRLGCEAYALDLNPVAHIIQLCTLVYPQKYGKPDPTARGMTGPKNAKSETTWGGLAGEVRYWGNWVLDRVRKEIGDLYPPIPDPAVWDTPPEIAFDRKTGQWNVTKPGKPKRGVKLEALAAVPAKDAKMFEGDEEDDCDGESSSSNVQLPSGFLQPVAYLWTRTVRCKNPRCGATVPLVRQTWLCKKAKAKRFVALRMHTTSQAKQAQFEVVEQDSEEQLGFDPTAFSNAGNATCPFCGTVADSDFVQNEGCEHRIGRQLLAIVCTRPGFNGKRYLASRELPEMVAVDSAVLERTKELCIRTGLTVPSEPISPLRPSPNARGLSGLTRYGVTNFGMLFVNRQHLLLLSICSAAHDVATAQDERAKSVLTYLALLMGRIANQNCAFTVYNTIGEKIEGPMGDKKVPMIWDFPETNPFSGVTGGVDNALGWIVNVCRMLDVSTSPGVISRGDATQPVFPGEFFDAVITDPPYYDNVPYADIADFFYVWFRRCIGQFHPDHFSSELTPKKSELTALSARHSGDMAKANDEYETGMQRALAEANRVLRSGGELVIVYAHKTTLGWATLVEGLRRSGFVVREAWPLQTEMPAGKVKIDKAMLASSIFLVARKRMDHAGAGNYEDDVQPELQQIVRERVETLWEMGIAGADLVIACVGAGLRAFTKYEKVEYANGEEVPAEKFLAEVEAVVLDAMLAKLSGVAGGNVSTVDHTSRFYVLWRFVYKTAELDAGEAIVFSNGTHIELDGAHGLSNGKDALVEKKKAKYRLRDFTERGGDEKLGLPSENGQPAPLIDALHRILWLMDNSPRKLNEFLDEARPDRERLRVLAQALAGAALSGKSEADADRLVSTTPAEQSALGKLLANWRTLIEEGAAAAVVGKKAAKEDKQTEQRVLPFGRN